MILIISTYCVSIPLIEQTTKEGLLIRCTLGFIRHIELVVACRRWMKRYRHSAVQWTDASTSLRLLSCNYSIFIFFQLSSGFQNTDQLSQNTGSKSYIRRFSIYFSKDMESPEWQRLKGIKIVKKQRTKAHCSRICVSYTFAQRVKN